MSDQLVPPRWKSILLIGQDDSSISEYADSFGKPRGFGVRLVLDAPTVGLSEPLDDGTGSIHADGLLQRYGNDVVLDIAVQLKGFLESVFGGTHDDNIRSIATWVKTAGVTAYVRPGFDFDGTWNEYQPQNYVLAFQHFVDIFRSVQVPNAQFVWHSAVRTETFGGFDRLLWYPGDEHVDIFGVSVLTAFYADDNPRNQAHEQKVRDLEDFGLVASQHSKPLMIAEAYPRGYHLDIEGEEAWDNFFWPMFDFIERFDVHALLYMNCPWDTQQKWLGLGWGDSRLEISNVGERWRLETSGERWDDPLGKGPLLPAPEPTSPPTSPPTPLPAPPPIQTTPEPIASTTAAEQVASGQPWLVRTPGVTGPALGLALALAVFGLRRLLGHKQAVHAAGAAGGEPRTALLGQRHSHEHLAGRSQSRL